MPPLPAVNLVPTPGVQAGPLAAGPSGGLNEALAAAAAQPADPRGSGLGGIDLGAPPSSGSGGGTGSISGNTAILRILKRYPKWKPYVALIKGIADELDVDDVYLLAAVATRNPKPEQIPQFARKYAAALRKYGTVDGAYAAVVPGATRGPSAIIPKRYVGGIDLTPTGGGGGGGRTRQPKLTPEQQVALGLYKSALREELTNPWVVLRNGKISFVSNRKNPGTPPKVRGSLKIRRDEFQSAWSDLNGLSDLFIGRKLKAGEVAGILKKGWSEFQIKNWLSKKPAFKKSAIYRSAAPGLIGVARDILGQAWNGVGNKDELLRKAIVEGWDSNTFAEKLRQTPQYLKGPEFQTNRANLVGVYESIYGIPNVASLRTIEEATLARWTPDQFGQWLREQPGYTSSGEYLAKAMSVLDTIGAITGTLPMLSPGATPPSPYPGSGVSVPNNPRIPGAPSAPMSPTPGLVPGMVGV